MLPQQPEELPAICNRIPEALRFIYAVEEVAANIHGENRPSNQRRHVFDFQDGIRMVLTVDIGSRGTNYLAVHASFSFVPGAFPTIDAFAHRVKIRCDEIFPRDRVSAGRDLWTRAAVHKYFLLDAFVKHYGVKPELKHLTSPDDHARN